MNKFFLDTNVVPDFVLNRPPFDRALKEIFLLGADEKVDLKISALTLCEINRLIIQKAISAIEFSDFEDCVQFFAASEIAQATHIITRDPKGFSPSTIPVFSPADYLAAHF